MEARQDPARSKPAPGPARATGRTARRIGVAAVGLVAGVVALIGFGAARPVPPATPADVADEAVAVALKPAEVAVRAPPSRVDYRRLEARIAELMADPDMVGLAVGTIEGGQVRFLRGFGEVAAGSGVPVTADTVFRWASLSKGVAAALVVGLAEDGKLSLDAPVSALGTSLALPGDAGRVRVADLLSHRVGIVRNAWDDRLEAGEDPKMLRAALGSLPPYCVPATCYTYQNIAFDAATEIVERVSGEDYAGLARRRLFQPLGMTGAGFGRAQLEASADWARPHRREKTPTVVNDSYYRVPAAGGANGSIRDLVRWMEAQMGAAPAVLSDEVIQTMHQPLVRTPPRRRQGAMDRAMTDAAYGMGWRSVGYAGRTLVGHRGSVDGYGSLILFDPADRSGIVMLWNSNNRLPARLQLEFFDMLYGLAFTDWLALEPATAAPAVAVASEPDGEG